MVSVAYDAVAFLEGLIGHNPAHERDEFRSSGVHSRDLPVEWWQLWDERAAIMEYDGNLPRERAEALALDDILKQMELAGITYPSDYS